MRAGLPLALLSALAPTLTPAPSPAGEAPSVPPDPARLERLVRQDCGSCHGLTLKGGLGPEITPQAMAHWDEEALAAVILDGVPETPMPPWRPLLSEEEVAWIVRYLKGEIEP